MRRLGQRECCLFSPPVSTDAIMPGVEYGILSEGIDMPNNKHKTYDSVVRG